MIWHLILAKPAASVPGVSIKLLSCEAMFVQLYFSTYLFPRVKPKAPFPFCVDQGFSSSRLHYRACKTLLHVLSEIINYFFIVLRRKFAYLSLAINQAKMAAHV